MAIIGFVFMIFLAVVAFVTAGLLVFIYHFSPTKDIMIASVVTFLMAFFFSWVAWSNTPFTVVML